MDKSRLDSEINRLYKNISFLWDTYNYHLAFFTCDFGIYGRGFIVGFENDICRLVFLNETISSLQPRAVYVGKKTASFSPLYYSFIADYGWYSINELVYWLRDFEYEYHNDTDKDLKTVNRYLKLQIDKFHELFRNPEELDSKLEYYRNQQNENQISVEKIRDERARVHTLDQDSPLGAAIKNLQRGQ